MEHAFNTSVAKEYCVDIAILLNNFKNWTIDNLANNINIRDGLCWTRNTLDAFQVTFQFWTRRQLETIISNAVKAGLIKKGNYNKNRYDRTCWYALTYKSYDYFTELRKKNNFAILSKSISEQTNNDCY